MAGNYFCLPFFLRNELVMIGLGYRKDFAEEFMQSKLLQPAFIEVAPENWIGVGGYWKKEFTKALEKYLFHW